MNAALIWIVFPGLLGGILFFFRRWRVLIAIIGISVTLLLSLLAWIVPFDELITLGPWVFKITETLTVAGRFFILENVDRPMLALIYLAVGFWFGGSLAANVDRIFIPLGLAMVATLVAALAVRPFLYAALLIEIAVLISVPILSPPGRPVGKGVIRYLTFQSLGVPFILLAGWFLTGVQEQPADPELALRITLLVSLAFSFLLAIFPLNTWIPLLAAETHPYAAAYIFSTIPAVVFLFAFGFLENYPWLLSPEVLQIVGLLMIATGGLWAAFQRDLARLMGYAVILGIGYSILVMSLPEALDLYFSLFVTRLVSLGVWALALSGLRRSLPDLSFESIKGTAGSNRLLAASLILANFSLGGIPLLANFPFYLALWERLFTISPLMAIWAILGLIGVLVGGLRALIFIIMEPENGPVELESGPFLYILLGIGLVTLFALGIFPDILYPIIQQLSLAF